MNKINVGDVYKYTNKREERLIVVKQIHDNGHVVLGVNYDKYHAFMIAGELNVFGCTLYSPGRSDVDTIFNIFVALKKVEKEQQ